MYQHMDADKEWDGEAVAWDAANSSAPLQPPRSEREMGEEGEEEVMDTTQPDSNTQEVGEGSSLRGRGEETTFFVP